MLLSDPPPFKCAWCGFRNIDKNLLKRNAQPVPNCMKNFKHFKPTICGISFAHFLPLAVSKNCDQGNRWSTRLHFAVYLMQNNSLYPEDARVSEVPSPQQRRPLKGIADRCNKHPKKPKRDDRGQSPLPRHATHHFPGGCAVGLAW